MDDSKSSASKASLFLRSFRSRTASSTQPAVPDAGSDVRVLNGTVLADIHSAIDALLQTKPDAPERPPQLRFLIETLRKHTENDGALLDPATATPLVSSLTVLCSRLMRPKYALDVRLGTCELLTATLKYAEESTAQSGTPAHDAAALTGWNATMPTHVLSALDRALLFRLVVGLRDDKDWEAAALVRDPGRAMYTLSCQLTALQALSRDGRDILAFREIIVVLTQWIGPAWGCIMHLRSLEHSQEHHSLLTTSEQCAYTVLHLMAGVIKFHASRLSCDQLQAALLSVTQLILEPSVPSSTADEAVTADEINPPVGDSLTHGFSYYGLEVMSPYFSTPRLKATAQPLPEKRAPSHERASEWVTTVSDAKMPELKESDVRALVKVPDAAICFAFLPPACITPIVHAMCRAQGLPALRTDADALLTTLQFRRDGMQGEMWAFLTNLLRSHCANSVLRTVCQLLWPRNNKEAWMDLPFTSAQQRAEPSVLVGALLFLHAALIWAAEDRLENGMQNPRAGKDDGAMTLLSLPAIAGAVQGALEKDIAVLDLATVLFLDDYLPERRVDMGARVDPLLEPRVRQAPVPLCTLFHENDVQADWDLLLDLQVLAKRHMAVWKSAQGARPTPAATISIIIIHILVEILSGTPVDSRESEPVAGVRDRTVAAMPHLSSLFWSLAPLLPDHVMVDMVLQNRQHHAYVPSSPDWIENTVELVNTFYPPQLHASAPAIAPMARFEVVQLISNMYDAVQDMPQFRNEMIEQVVVPLLERALCLENSPEIEAMLRAMLRHAATVSAFDASVGQGQPFTRLRHVLVESIHRAQGLDATSERKQARAQHSRQQSLGPSNMNVVRETQARIQRAIRSVRDMVTIFYQLSFALPNAAVMLPYDVHESDEVRDRAQACSVSLFRDLLVLVQCNDSFNLTSSGISMSGTGDLRTENTSTDARAPYTMHIPTQVRLVILQWLMRLRADRHHQIYFVHNVDKDVEPLAQLIQRTDEREERGRVRDEREERGRVRDERPAPDTRGRSRAREPSGERGRSERRTEQRERSASRAPDAPMLWSVPETLQVDLPDEGWPSTLWKVYAHEHVDDELPAHEPGAGEPLVMPTSEYLGVLINLLQSEADWEVVSYIIAHLPAQLSNKPCFCGPHTREQISALNDMLCTLLLQQKQFPNLILPEDVKRTDMYAVVYATMMVLVSYRRLLSRTQHDELLEAFIAGLTKSQNTAQPCVRALVVASYELQKSFTRLVAGVLVKLSTIMSSMTVSVHILELLVEISGSPALYANFTESDYKRVFGIALQYIQYHQSSAASSREDIRSSPAKFSLSQYVMMLAYSNIAQWFITLRLSDRAKHVPYITRGLMLANEGREKLTDQTFVCLDFLARFTYSNAQSKPTRSLIRFLVTSSDPTQKKAPNADSNASQTWVMGKGLVTITSLRRAGWLELVVRRPSGTTSMVAKLENEPSATLVDEERMAEALPKTLARTRALSALSLPSRTAPSPLTHSEFYKDKHSEVRRKFPGALTKERPAQEKPAEAPTPAPEAEAPASAAAPETSSSTASAARNRENAMNPAYLALQLSAFPDMVVDKAPIRLPAEPATDRLLRAIDLTPVYDFHKIGVLYAGFHQSSEKEILSNTHGSSAYMKFLSRLGDLVPLRGQEDVYTGGLDRQEDEHGKYAYVWKDNIKQIVYHTATLMPNRPTDPNHSAKKALIGNDWVHIIFNEANQPYEFGTIASQFNFVNIVISPHSKLKNGVEAYEVNDDMFCTSYFLLTQSLWNSSAAPASPTSRRWATANWSRSAHCRALCATLRCTAT